MDVGRPTALIGFLVAVGLVLIALPVVLTPEVPDDRVEFYVEGDWQNYEDQTTLVYGNLSAAERAVFDATRGANSGTLNRTPAAAPESLTPPADSIVLYNVRYDGAYYGMQVKHLTYEADFVTQHLPRLGSMGLGTLCLFGAAYRRYGV